MALELPRAKKETCERRIVVIVVDIEREVEGIGEDSIFESQHIREMFEAGDWKSGYDGYIPRRLNIVLKMRIRGMF